MPTHSINVDGLVALDVHVHLLLDYPPRAGQATRVNLNLTWTEHEHTLNPDLSMNGR